MMKGYAAATSSSRRKGQTATAIAAEETQDDLILVDGASPPTQRSPCETDSPGAIETDGDVWNQQTQQQQRELTSPQRPREGSTAQLLPSLAVDCSDQLPPKAITQQGEEGVSLLMRLRGGGGSSEEKPSDSKDEATRKRPRTADASIEAASRATGTAAANDPTGTSSTTSLEPGASASSPPVPPPAKRGRKKRPKEMPRRPLSAYNLFFKHERDRLTQQQSTVEIIQLATEIKEPPEGAPPWTLFQALSILIPKRWHALQNSDRIQYEEMAKESMAEYQKKLHLYQIQKARLSLEEHEAAARQQEQLQQQAQDHHHEDEDQEEEDEDSKMPAAAMPPQPPAVGDFSNLIFPGLLYPQAISAAAGDAGTTGASSNNGTTTTGERVSGSETSETRSQQAPMIDPMVALQSQLMAQLNPQHANTTAATPQIHESPLEALIRISDSQQQPVGPQPAAAPSSSSSETNNSSLAASGLEPEGIIAISNLVQALQNVQGTTPTSFTQQQPSQGHELPANPAQAILSELTRVLAPPPPPPQPDPALVNALQTMLQSVLRGMQQQQEGGNEDGAGAQTTNQNQNQNMQALFMAFLQALVSVSQQSSDSNCNIS